MEPINYRGDVIQIEASLTKSGKHGVRSDLLICDCGTSEILVRASSNMALLNKSTRRLSKLPDEVQAKMDQFPVDRPPVIVMDAKTLPKLDEAIADHVRRGLMPRWTDLDDNQHVNNVKYIGWILESVPFSIMKDYELTSMTLKYHQECRKDCMLQSLTSVSRNDKDSFNHVDFHHMIQLEDGGGVIMKGWTRWRRRDQNT